MAPLSSKVFTSKRGQTVDLPEAAAFPESVRRVDILKIGCSRVLVPPGQRWDDLFRNGPRLREDFMTARKQPGAEKRETI